MNKGQDYDYNPIKEQINGHETERVVWSTKSIYKALEGKQKGQPLKATPFYNNITRLLKPELVYKRTKEEIDDYIKCKMDPVYFASKCYLMTPEGLQPCKLRDYQVDYLRHLQKNRFSIFLSCRQSGKCFSMLSAVNIFIKNSSQFDTRLKKINYFYIKDNIYEIPIFEVYNLYCKQTLIWKCKYQLYKIIYRLMYGRQKRTKDIEET